MSDERRNGHGANDGLVPVDDHVDRILSTVVTPSPIELALVDTYGLLCAEEVRAAMPLPGFDNSSMDGYAVRAADVATASESSPVTLPVIGDVAAGAQPTQTVGPGVSTRIMTGAPIPSGADAVVPVEWTDGGVARVSIRRPAPTGAHIRPTGDDLDVDDVAVPAGTAIGPAQVGLLAAVGRERVLVRPRPRVVVLSTGSELVDVGRTPGHGEVVDANSYLLAAAAREAGADVYRAGIVPDDRRALMEALEGHLPRAELLITSGGVSMGAFDVVKETLAELGTVEFTRVAMQPGMPQGFGTLGEPGTPIFCLPGNPVSALVSFEVFVRPAIRRMLGRERLFRRPVTAVTSDPLTSPRGKRQYRRGRLYRNENGGFTVSVVGGPGSHLLAGLARSNCLIVVHEEVTDVGAGSHVNVVPLVLAGH